MTEESHGRGNGRRSRVGPGRRTQRYTRARIPMAMPPSSAEYPATGSAQAIVVVWPDLVAQTMASIVHTPVPCGRVVQSTASIFLRPNSQNTDPQYCKN